MATLSFDLDVTPDSDEDLGLVIAGVFAAGVTAVTIRPGEGGSPFIMAISAPSEAIAFMAVNVVYGDENDSRDSNRFFVYGDE